MLGEELVHSRVGLVDEDKNEVEAGQQRTSHPEVFRHSLIFAARSAAQQQQAWRAARVSGRYLDQGGVSRAYALVVAAGGICCGNDAGARRQRTDNAGLGNADALLLHGCR